jgi:Ca-activated chloride channel family protein
VRRRLIAAGMAAAALLSACVNVGSSKNGSGAPNGCTNVNVATSPEKFDLLTNLAQSFNTSSSAKQGGCVFVQVQKKSSGIGSQNLVDGWADETADGPKPTVWSPAASSWGAITNQRLTAKGQAAVAPTNAKSFMLTPLVIAMPRPMAEALGWPANPIGYADLLKLARDPQGWAGKGHPEWGAFKLGKTNPNFSTSALSATIAQYYAATNKVRDLSLEDLDRPDVAAYSKAIESSVVHYGDITLTFLNNWYRNDQRGTALTYVSAVAVEEKSVIDYNVGNPDGILQPGEKPRKPKVPLVAIYPKEGTLFSDSPFYVLNAPWVTAKQKDGASRFETFVQEPANQRQVLKFGFRPGNPQVAVGSPITPANGVDPGQPQTTLGVPSPPVLVKLIDRWAQDRKGARVMLVIDVSGSMGEDAGNGQTKLELAQQAATTALDQFKSDDLVGLRIFSTNLQTKEPQDYIDLVPLGPIAANREQLASKIRSLIPTQGTPLYTVARASYDDLRSSYDPARINAVVLLTDGANQDPRNGSSDALDRLVTNLRSSSEGASSTPVRLFTIAYGKDARLDVLQRMAEATNAAAYDAGDPTTIDKVFTAVVSNF